MAPRIFIALSVVALALPPTFAGMRKALHQFHVEAPTPVITVLGQVGLHVESGFLSFGIDLRLEDSEPKVTLHVQPGQDTTDALLQIMTQLPGYTFDSVSSHLVNVYSTAASDDPQDILNVRVANFEVNNEPPMNILSNPSRFMPELKKRQELPNVQQQCGSSLGPGLGSMGPGITLKLENMTVREILNRVAEASSALAEQADSPAVVPLGWVHISRISKAGAPEVHEWRGYSTAPANWRAQRNKQ